MLDFHRCLGEKNVGLFPIIKAFNPGNQNESESFEEKPQSRTLLRYYSLEGANNSPLPFSHISLLFKAWQENTYAVL